jgi:AmiR/NasT family two-component response regulator
MLGAAPSTLNEDEYLVAAAAEEALTFAGYVAVGTAATAEEAVEMALSQSPDLIVMDVKLALAQVALTPR